ncbi:MAG TPA: tape measure protein [Siphovirus UK_ancient_CT89]|nr:MAG TPA: tape measure protein [Siphovirus UK_ancient_CT89]
MASIEERVVSLKFNNGQFMNGVQDSLNGVKKLEEGLAFRGGVEGINQVSAAAKNLNFSEAQAGVAETTSRFSALQSVAFGALASIGGKITEIGSSMLSSFTVQPLIDGMKEYELQLNSVQTILANTAQKGETIQTVNAALDQLNTYADQTIYNFGEMTSNIGKFTAAGIGLDDSVASIKGLANWAAVAGANSEATSRAMYQLSQAMSAGTVKLQDWMSLENAGIATKQFQDQLIQTAQVHGKSVDEMIAKNGSFRLSLQEGWLDQEIMMETLKQMAGEYSDEQLASMGYTEEQIAQIQELAKTGMSAAQDIKTFSQLMGVIGEELGSSWAQSFRIIFGDFEQAKALWSQVGAFLTGPSGIITQMGNARNALLQGWADLGGREKVLEGLASLFHAMWDPLQRIGQAFSQVFSGPSAEGLYSISEAFANFMAKLVPSESTIESLGMYFEAFFRVIKIGVMVLSDFGKIVAWIAGGALKGLGALISSLRGHTADWSWQLRDHVQAIQEWYDNLNVAENVIKAIIWVGKGLKRIWGNFSEGFHDEITPSLRRLREAWDELWEALKSAGSGIKEAVVGPFRELKQGAQEVGQALGIVSESTDDAGDSAEENESKFTKLKNKIVDLFESAFEKSYFWGQHLADHLIPAIEKLTSFINWLTECINKQAVVVEDWLTPKMRALAELYVEISTKFSEWAEQMKNGPDIAWLSSIGGILKSVGSGVWGVLKNLATLNFDFDVEPFKKAFHDLKMLMGEYAMSVWYGWRTTKAFIANLELKDKATAGWRNFVKLVQGIGKVLGAIGKVAAVAAKALIEPFKGAFSELKEKADNGDYTGIFDSILKAGALATFIAMARKVISTLKEWGEAGSSFAGILGSVKDVIDGFKDSMEATTNKVKATTILILAGAVLVLAAALWVVAQIPANKIVAAGAALYFMFNMLKKAEDELSGSGEGKDMKGLAKRMLALVVLAGVALLLGKALSNIGSMDWDDILKGCIGLYAVIRMMLTMADTTTKKNKDILAFALTAIPLGLGVLLLAKAVKPLGEMSLADLTQGVLALGLIMKMMAMMSQMGTVKIKKASAFAFLALAFTMRQIAKVLTEIGELSWGDTIKGIIAMDLCLASLTIAVERLGNDKFSSGKSLVGAISVLILAATLKLVANEISEFADMDWGTYAKGLTMMSVALGILVGISQLGSGGIGGAAALLVTTMALAMLVPVMRTLGEMDWGTAGKGIAIMALGLGALVAIGYIADAAAIGLLALGGAILMIGYGVGLATGGIANLVNAIANLSTTGADGVQTFLDAVDGFIERMPQMGTAIGEAFINFMQVFVDNQGTIVEYIKVVLTSAAQAMIESIPTFVELMITIIHAIIQVVYDCAQEIIDCAIFLIITLSDALIENMPALVERGSDVLTSFLEGLSYKIPEIGTKATDCIVAFLQSLGDNMPRITQAAFETIIKFINGLADAIENNSGALTDAGIRLITAIRNGIVTGIQTLVSTGVSQMRSAGRQMVTGLKNAIIGRLAEIGRAVRNMGDTIVRNTKAAFGIHSPSRVMYEIGDFMMQGLSNGISENTEQGIDAASTMAHDTVDAFAKGFANTKDIWNDALGGDMDPTIKPVLDLSQVEEQAGKIQELLPQGDIQENLSANMTTQLAGRAVQGAQSRIGETVNETVNNGSSVVFNQYNTSPKALSETEIYRQTHNQIEQFRGAMYDL